ncbi:MAG: ComEC family competence protein [Bacteroidales bacterium]|nr:ComEC family competence protein [Bacteroidales bacterium]
MRHPLLPVVALVALVILVCEGFFGLFSQWKDPSRSASHYANFVDGDQYWMRVHINDIPEERERTIRVTAEVLEIADSNESPHICNGKILVYFEKPSNVDVGDELLILTTPRLPNGSDNPHQFNYRRHLQRHGILYTAYVPASNYHIMAHSGYGFKARLTTLRQKLINVIHFSKLTPSQQGIAEALILGWDGDLDEKTQTKFRSAGITHLLCVSGLHVGIVALLVGWSLFFLSNRKVPRIIKGTIQILAIWAFVAITGMAPSAMRAGLMFSLIVLGQMFFTKPPTLNTVAASALIILVTNPLLLFDIGFQLSYSAVIAIILFTKPLENLIPIPESNKWATNLLFKLLKKIRTLLCVCLSAQLAVTPLTLFYFHNFSPYFLVANMTIVPFAALLLGSVLLMIIVCWWPLAFKAVGVIVSALISVTEHITSAVSSWPYALVEGIYFDQTMLVLSLVTIFIIGWLIVQPRWNTAFLSLVLITALTLYSRLIDYRCSLQLHFDIYNVGNRTAVEFFNGKVSTLLCDPNTASNPECIDFQTANNLIWRKAERTRIISLDSSYEDDRLFVKNRFIGFNNRTFRIVDRSNYRQLSASRPHIDYLLLRESPFITVSELLKQYSFDTIVITSQNSLRRRSAWKQECDSIGIPYIE